MSKPAVRPVRLGLGALLLIAAAAGCASSKRIEAPSTSSAVSSPAPTTTARSAVVVETGFPTEATTGVPAGVTLRKWTGSYQTRKSKNLPTEKLDGRSCKVFEGYWFDLADTGSYLYVDDPCVVFRNVRFTTNGLVSNTSAMLEQAAENKRLLVEASEFDGGPHHQRGIQADYGGLTVRGSSFTRFGNAAAEMNDPAGKGAFVAEGNYLYEPGGWDPTDHVDGFQVGGGGAITIHNNTVLIEPYGAVQGDDNYVSNSALGLWAEIGDVAGPVTVDHNLLAGGGFVMYLEQKSPYRWVGPVTVTNNVFDARFVPHGGIWGLLAPNSLPADLVWQGNTWNDGTALDLTTAKG